MHRTEPIKKVYDYRERLNKEKNQDLQGKKTRRKEKEESYLKLI